MQNKRQRAEYYRKWRAEQKLKGLCVNCGKQATVEKTKCSLCAEFDNKRIAKKVAERKTKGLCTRCNMPTRSGKTFCSSCAEKAHVYYLCRKDKGLCVSCGKQAIVGNTLCYPCCEKNSIRTLKRRKKLKIETFNNYGGCVCVCCGETTLDFLTLDHVNNDGAQHRQITKRGGTLMYSYLKKHNFPNTPPLQILCYNCNCAKQFSNGCPHKKQSADLLLETVASIPTTY